eukprot:Nitzschia sp. Nitz4//scaffold321_size20361//8383//8937//NITZ4_008684-RA/size20361-processed-gene-0.31-mRNA-1//1//CDS//3329547778//5581//frame0
MKRGHDSNDERPAKVLKQHPPIQSKRRVSFGRVDICEHAIILGDNPSVLDGPPVTIAWKCHKRETMSVDEFEMRNVNSDDDLCLSPEQRILLLLRAGFSADDINEAMEQVHQLQMQQQRDRILNHEPDVLAFLRADQANVYNDAKTVESIVDTSSTPNVVVDWSKAAGVQFGAPSKHTKLGKCA